MHSSIIVAGIGTEIGKTVVSAVLVEALKADYWKPVQSGGLDDTDTDAVRRLVSPKNRRFHPESYRLTQPLSPHAAAVIDGVTIDLHQLTLPKTENVLVIELAGGLMVPLNDRDLMIDLVKKLALPVVLVSRNYLGSINHTLLSVEACQNRRIPLLGILFTGSAVEATESFILNYTGLPYLGRINQEPAITPAVVQRYAAALSPMLNQVIDAFEQKF